MKLTRLNFRAAGVVAMMMMVFSCKDFIEPDISKRVVNPEAPSDLYQSNSYTVNFWWDEVEDALSYRLQVVTPGFDNAGGLVIDTLVKSDKFQVSLDPGDYQWRVRAENGSSQTAYSAPRNFTVLAASLTDQKPLLSAPANNTLTSQRAVLFKWGSLFSATKYRFQLDSNNFADETQIVGEQVIPGQQLNFTLPRDRGYQWRVRAENETLQSKWSAINTITVDATPPAVPTIISPKNNAQVSRPVLLQWSAPATAVKYRLYVFGSDSTTLYNSDFPMVLTNASYSFNLGNPGDNIYWQVSAIDAAGNESGRSALSNFSLQ